MRAPLRLFIVLVVLIAATSLCLCVGLAAWVGSSDGDTEAPTSAPGTTTGAIPPAMLALYRQAATGCPGLPWTVLAAIGTVESDNGRSTLPGVQSGANVAGAEGPMQFEPATFAAYDTPVPPGGAVPPSPYDVTDAVYAAARMLCADGASGGADIPGAIFAYNHSDSYVTEVLNLAHSYSQLGDPGGLPGQ